VAEQKAQIFSVIAQNCRVALGIIGVCASARVSEKPYFSALALRTNKSKNIKRDAAQRCSLVGYLILALGAQK
jgi:hypothetical protein